MDHCVPSARNASVCSSPSKSPNTALESGAVVRYSLRHGEVPPSDTCHSLPVARMMSVNTVPTKWPKRSCDIGCASVFRNAQGSRALFDHCHPVAVTRITSAAPSLSKSPTATSLMAVPSNCCHCQNEVPPKETDHAGKRLMLVALSSTWKSPCAFICLNAWPSSPSRVSFLYIDATVIGMPRISTAGLCDCENVLWWITNAVPAMFVQSARSLPPCTSKLCSTAPSSTRLYVAV